ncbi:hypothetical protein P171DRAFT_481257 [Karstenula rhodostoma CBS 690.94]|uniref:Uncharacterized protein n=1 Tax=Karstenula rhodostoma CBS 690.94 TaxID=1392251 RepID=A0A9P4PN32_9PLEO|nr:hypothetical protein P171DRAFT_481257 [Karstenula rhodostoma CBS 690.94]
MAASYRVSEQELPDNEVSHQWSSDEEMPDQAMSDQTLSPKAISDRALSDLALSDLALSDHTVPDQEMPDQGPSADIFWGAIISLLNELQVKGPGRIDEGLYPTLSYLQPGAHETLFFSHKTVRNLLIAKIFFRYENNEKFPIALYCRNVDGDEKYKSKERSRSKDLFKANIETLKAAAAEAIPESPNLIPGMPETPDDTEWSHMLAERDIELSHETFGILGEDAPRLPGFKVTAVFRIDTNRRLVVERAY